MSRKQLFLPILTLYLVLGCWKGYLAVFREGQPEPWQIYPTRVISLPQADQEALEKGIIVRSDRKLQQLLEDYLS